MAGYGPSCILRVSGPGWRSINSQKRTRPIYPAILIDQSKSLHTRQVAHQAGAYPGFCSMKQLGAFLLFPGWGTSPSQGYPQHLDSRYPFIHLGGERHCPRPGLEPRPLDPETSALTMRPPRLQAWSIKDLLYGPQRNFFTVHGG